MLSGDDSLTHAMISAGAAGVISVVGNSLTKTFSKMVHLGLEGNSEASKEIDATLQELYKDNPDELKKDFETATENGENLGRKIKVAIEEYANTGFSILDRRRRERPDYIENLEYVVDDILSDKTWSW